MMNMRKLFFLIAAVIFMMPGFGHAQDEDNAKARITRMIEKMRGHKNVSEIEMTVTRPAWTRTLKMKVWDDRSQKRVFIRLLAPAKEEGISFLRLGYNLWNYMPKVERVMKIPPSMMLQPWMGSDFTNDDLVKESSYIDDYDHKIVGREERDGLPVLRIELIPHPEAPVVWGKVIFWVREKDNLPLEEQFLDEGGRLIKDLRYSEFKTMDGTLLPVLWEMRPVLKEGQKTVIRFLTIDFDPSPPIAESVFTKQNLKP